MQFRTKGRQDERPGGEPPSGGAPGGNLDAVRRAGERFLSAGDDAINRALSGDSEKFLEANRQHGGQ